MVIKEVTRTVYFSPSKGRHYMTKKSALRAEASARLDARFPSEDTEFDDMGRITYPGFNWRNEPRAHVLLRRVIRLLKNK